MTMTIAPVMLAGRTVRLEPLAAHHAADLAAAAEPGIFRYHVTVPDFSPDGLRRYIDLLCSRPATIPFAQIHLASGKAIGVTTYLDIQPMHHALEIGTTWIATAHQGTHVNPEAKYLLLRHAFERCAANRVQLKTDARNLQSQRAIEKLGAVREGVLRSHIIMPDGFVRSSMLYSIVREAWPAVKARLEARLQA